MMQRLFKFTLLLFFFTAIGCTKTDSIDFSKQKVLFEKEYINFAWRYTHVGWYIDSIGSIYYYDKPQSWNTIDSTNNIKFESINSNLSNCKKLAYTIDKSELSAKIAQMSNAAKGSLSEPVMEMADAGLNKYCEFVYDSTTKRYKRIMLKQTGDLRIDNSSPESVSLWQWMNTIEAKVNAEITK